MHVIKRVPDALHDELYRQMEYLHGFFSKYNITYWANGGTLLGARREKRIILWDDDCDIGIFEHDKEFISSTLRTDAAQNGYELWNSVHGFELRTHPNNPTRNGYTGTIKTDLFIYMLTVDTGVKKYVLASDRSRAAWPRDWFLPEELSDLATFQFGKIQITSVSSPDRYLATVYGKDFMTTMYLDYNHLTGKSHPDKGICRPLSDIVVK